MKIGPWVVALGIVALGCRPATRPMPEGSTSRPDALLESSGQPPETTTSEAPTSDPTASVEAVPHAANGATTSADSPASGPIVARFVLDHPVMAAKSDPSVDVESRLDGTLVLKNAGREPVIVTGKVPAAFMLSWEILGRDGSRFEPTFLPPPMPRPGGWPKRTETIAPGQELPFAALHGVSGYRRVGQADSTWYRVLPVGSYTIVVSGLRFDAPAGYALRTTGTELVVKPR